MFCFLQKNSADDSEEKVAAKGLLSFLCAVIELLWMIIILPLLPLCYPNIDIIHIYSEKKQCKKRW